MSEHEIMYNRGIYRIYDCGNLRYIWTNPAIKQKNEVNNAESKCKQ